LAAISRRNQVNLDCTIIFLFAGNKLNFSKGSPHPV